MGNTNNEATVKISNIQSYKNIYRFLRMLWREQRLTAFLLAFITLILGLIAPTELWLIGQLVDSITKWADSPSIGLNIAYWLMAGFIILLLLRNWLRLLSEIIQDYLRDRVGGRVKQEVLEKSYQMELAYFEHEESYDQLQRANEGLEVRFVNIYQSLLFIIENIITVVGLTLILMTGHWVLGPIVLLVIFPSLWLKITRARQGYIFDYDSLTPTRRRLSYMNRLLSTRAFSKEVRLFQLGNHFLGKWQGYQSKWKRETLEEGKREIKFGVINDLFMNVVLGSAALFLAVIVVAGQVTLGAYVMMVQSVIRMQDELEMMLRHWRFVYQDALFAQNLFTFLDEPVNKRQGGETAFPYPLSKGIIFDHVWFRYPNSSDWVLKDVCFTIPAGSTISLVGRNGAGKTTLAKLLLGLYGPTKGNIYFDGISIEEIDDDSLKEHVSAIFQDFTRFELTLKESIGFGNIKHLNKMERIRHAAELTGVDDIAADLEHGYDTLLNKTFSAAELSGGQWQKVALARSMMKDADIWVLDEPTASLDPRAEMSIFDQFRTLTHNRTTVLISHRIGTARLADNILVLSKGEVIETGTHESLIKNGNEYASLFHVQAQWYKDAEEVGD